MYVIQIGTARRRLSHAFAVPVGRLVNAVVYEADGREGGEDHDDEVGEGVHRVDDAHWFTQLSRFVAEAPHAVTVSHCTQHGTQEGYHPAGDDEDGRSASVDVEVVAQGVDDAEVVVDAYEEDAEDGGGADEVGAALGEVAEEDAVAAVVHYYFLHHVLLQHLLSVVVRYDEQLR